MTTVRLSLKALMLMAFMLAFSALANAQATRTWVSGVGDDVNPCSRTAPCKTFAGAISKTADKGEIDALDPGGFGTVTITKNMTIDGTNGAGFGSILAAGTNGVNVNDSATASPNSITVTLKNLSIDGAGSGFDGIRMTSGKQLYVVGCQIFNFRGNGINSDGIDIAISPGNGAVLFGVDVRNSTFENNTGDGIRQTIASGTLNSSFDNVVLSGNSNGLESTGGTANISRSVINNNTSNGIIVSNGSIVNASSNQITSNGNGVNNSSTVRLSDNNIYRNTTGLAGAGTYNSFGNNHILGNGNDGVVPGITNPK
ncbi:MAG: right-handed parallel beta-helix repeat-containing protein [Pyrinomonadaceae bacterium]